MGSARLDHAQIAGTSKAAVISRNFFALDRHLADHMLLPLCFAGGVSEITYAAVTRHLETNAWVIEQFEIARVKTKRRVEGISLIQAAPAANMLL